MPKDINQWFLSPFTISQTDFQTRLLFCLKAAMSRKAILHSTKIFQPSRCSHEKLHDFFWLSFKIQARHKGGFNCYTYNYLTVFSLAPAKTSRITISFLIWDAADIPYSTQYIKQQWKRGRLSLPFTVALIISMIIRGCKNSFANHLSFLLSTLFFSSFPKKTGLRQSICCFCFFCCLLVWRFEAEHQRENESF